MVLKPKNLSVSTRVPEPQPRPDRRDALATDLRQTRNALRPTINDLRSMRDRLELPVWLGKSLR